VLFVLLVLGNQRGQILRFNVTSSPTVRRVEGMGIEEISISARSPWLNPFVERVIGSILRECLDHGIFFSEGQLRRVLKNYVEYYHRSRTHLELAKDCPVSSLIEPPDRGAIDNELVVGGLHHRCFRRAARSQSDPDSRCVRAGAFAAAGFKEVWSQWIHGRTINGSRSTGLQRGRSRTDG
jgi:hypothetical protein